MKKVMNWTSIISFCKKSINQMGFTWEDLSEKFNLTVNTLQKHVRESYSRKGDWDNLLERARKNKLAKKKVEEVIPKQEQNDVQEVILADTGFLMDVGVQWIMEQSLDVYVSELTIRELSTLSRSYKVAYEVLDFYWATRRMVSINLYGKEDLVKEPTIQPKKARTRNIVAVAVRLVADGKKVQLMTNSWAVVSLAKHQGLCNIDPIYKGSATE